MLKFDDRARPTVREQQGQGLRSGALFVDEMKLQAIERHGELRQCVEPALLGAPIIGIRANRRSAASYRQGWTRSSRALRAPRLGQRTRDNRNLRSSSVASDMAIRKGLGVDALIKKTPGVSRFCRRIGQARKPASTRSTYSAIKAETGGAGNSTAPLGFSSAPERPADVKPAIAESAESIASARVFWEHLLANPFEPSEKPRLWEGKDKSIRALERALDVLQALQGSKAMELKDLRRPPKATFLRILTTLQSRDAALDHGRRPARRIRRGRARGCGVPD